MLPRTKEASLHTGLPLVKPAWSPSCQAQGQAGPPPAVQDRSYYITNFPNAPGQRHAQATPQPKPTAAPARPPHMSHFQALKGNWDEMNSLINLDNMQKVLDIYVNMLRSARNMEELFAENSSAKSYLPLTSHHNSTHAACSHQNRSHGNHPSLSSSHPSNPPPPWQNKDLLSLPAALSGSLLAALSLPHCLHNDNSIITRSLP